MSIYEPEAVESQGNVRVAILAAVAILTAVDLSTEIGGAGTVDVTLTFNDWAPTRTPNTGTSPRRVGTRSQMPREGNMQYQAISITYPDDPQADPGDPTVAAKEALEEGAIVFVLVRKGIPAETAWAIGQKYELWKCRTGAQIEGKSGDDEFAEFQVQQNLYPLHVLAKGAIVA